MHGEPGHLGQIAHRGLGRVGLPIGVGDEAHRRIEGEIGRDRIEMLRIEGKDRLQALQGVKGEEARQTEGEHGEAVALPVLLLIFLDAAQRIDCPLEGPQWKRQKSALAFEDAGHIIAERLHEEDDHRAKKRDLNKTIDGHEHHFLKSARGVSRR